VQLIGPKKNRLKSLNNVQLNGF